VAGLLLRATRAGDIDRLLQQATAHSSTAVSSKCEQCHVVSRRKKLKEGRLVVIWTDNPERSMNAYYLSFKTFVAIARQCITAMRSAILL